MKRSACNRTCAVASAVLITHCIDVWPHSSELPDTIPWRKAASFLNFLSLPVDSRSSANVSKVFLFYQHVNTFATGFSGGSWPFVPLPAAGGVQGRSDMEISDWSPRMWCFWRVLLKLFHHVGENRLHPTPTWGNKLVDTGQRKDKKWTDETVGENDSVLSVHAAKWFYFTINLQDVQGFETSGESWIFRSSYLKTNFLQHSNKYRQGKWANNS